MSSQFKLSNIKFKEDFGGGFDEIINRSFTPSHSSTTGDDSPFEKSTREEFKK